MRFSSRRESFVKRGISRGRCRHESPLSVGSNGQAGVDIFISDIRKIREDILIRYAGSKMFENIMDGDPQPSNMGSLPRFPFPMRRFRVKTERSGVVNCPVEHLRL